MHKFRSEAFINNLSQVVHQYCNVYRGRGIADMNRRRLEKRLFGEMKFYVGELSK